LIFKIFKEEILECIDTYRSNFEWSARSLHVQYTSDIRTDLYRAQMFDSSRHVTILSRYTSNLSSWKSWLTWLTNHQITKIKWKKRHARLKIWFFRKGDGRVANYLLFPPHPSTTTTTHKFTNGSCTHIRAQKTV